eukprot:11205839-Lingulodinium_polyedra.AAC.1
MMRGLENRAAIRLAKQPPRAPPISTASAANTSGIQTIHRGRRPGTMAIGLHFWIGPRPNPLAPLGYAAGTT